MRLIHTIPALALLAVAVGGCPNTSPPSAPAPNLPALQNQPAAAILVDGQPITMDQITELLIANTGLSGPENLIASAVVQQAATREAISITSADIEAEHVAALNRLPAGLTRQQQEEVLDQQLAQRGISRLQWDMTIRRNAILAKMAAKQVRVTDEMVQNEFNRIYGSKVQIRHIQCNTMTDAQNVIDLLEKGAEFEDLAKRLSTNAESAATGGLVAPFGRDTAAVSAAIRTAAFALREGQTSDIVQEGTRFHVLKVEKVIPPADKKLADVEETLREQLRTQQIQAEQLNILNRLIHSANIEYLNPQLKKLADQRRSRAGSAP